MTYSPVIIIKMKQLSFYAGVFLLYLSFCGTSCEECFENHYYFNEKIEYYPVNKTLHIGDTLWLYSFIRCDRMLETVTGDTVSFCDIPDLSTYFGIVEFVPDTARSGYPKGAFAKFDVAPEIGDTFTIENGVKRAYGLYLRYEEVYSGYEVLVGFMPKDTGKYSISVANTGGPLFPWKKRYNCVDKGHFNLAIQNADLHSEILYEFWAGRDDVNITPGYASQFYCFEVVN